jgi:hypothetical protein
LARHAKKICKYPNVVMPVVWAVYETGDEQLLEGIGDAVGCQLRRGAEFEAWLGKAKPGVRIDDERVAHAFLVFEQVINRRMLE